MNKIRNIFTIILFFSMILILFKSNYILEVSVTQAFNIWLHRVFPSLFIMFILSDIIINLNLLDNICLFFNKIFNKLFHTTNKSGEVFLLSLISGTPTSTYIILKMYEKNNITLEDANKLISYTYFSNPLFLYNILSLTFNKYIVIKIIFFHYISNLLVAFFKRQKKTISNNITTNNSTNNNLLILLPKSIQNSFNTLLLILGTITFYMIITNLITYYIPLNNLFNILIKGFLEITQSLNVLNSLNYTSIIKEIIALSIISFGGLSIHTQVLAILNDSKIKYKYFLKGRIWQVLLSTITYLIYTILII